METTTNYNSGVNQDIKQKLVRQHIYLNVGQLIEESHALNMLDHEQGINLYEEIGEYYEYNGEKYTYDQIQNLIAELEQQIYEEESTEEKDQELQQQIEELQDIEPSSHEPLEYWAVSNYFAEKLTDQNEVIIQHAGLNIWGRTCSGQAILLDYCISKIAEGMEILKGQDNEWNV